MNSHPSGRYRARHARTGRSLASALALMALLIGAMASTATASYTAIDNPTGPLTRIAIGDTLTCQAFLNGVGQIYPTGGEPADCGTFVSYGGSLYHPTFDGTASSAASSKFTGPALTPVSQTAVGGSGSALDPYTVTTVAAAGSSLELSQTDAYVVGNDFMTSWITVHNTSTSTVTARLFRGWDCYLGGSDSGYGVLYPATKGVACAANANNSPPGLVQAMIPDPEQSPSFMQGGWSDVWAAIAGAATLPNTCQCGDQIDNGEALSWDLELAPGASITRVVNAGYSPVGAVPPLPDIATPPPVNTAAPVVSGTARSGETLSATKGTWSNDPTDFAYQWQRCDADGGDCVDIDDATSSTYTLTADDVDATVRVTVSATNDGGAGSAPSTATGVVAPPLPANTAPPGITGEAREGVELSASEGTWTNSPTAFAYQWQRCDADGGDCADIADATSSAYTLTVDDVGSTVVVRVTATNAGGDEAASSAATGVVLPLTPTNTVAPPITGDAREGSELSASSGTWLHVPTVFAYQWQRCDADGGDCADIADATSTTYTLTADDVGSTVVVQVQATNAGGTGTATSAASDVVLPLAPESTAPPAIAGEARDGTELSASTGTWSHDPTGFAYQWRRCDADGGDCADIADATSATYTLTADDIGSTVVVRVQATNAGGTGTATSAASDVVLPLAPVSTVSPAISGEAREGSTLLAGSGTWSHDPTGYAYQWRRCDADGENCADIDDATSSAYTLTADDVGSTVVVRVQATNAGGTGATTSASSDVVVPLAPANTVLPVISGELRQGSELSASTGTWSHDPTDFAYQWRRCDADGDDCVDIDDATSSTYTLTAAEIGSTVVVRVTATNAGGSGTATSTASVAVLPLAPANTVLPVISGEAREGVELSVSDGTWSHDPTGFAYQWQRCDADGAHCADIDDATSATYTLTADDIGSTVVVRVQATNDGGTTTVASAATDVVLPIPPANTAPPAIGGELRQGSELSASEGAWTHDPTGFAYQWQRCDADGAHCVDIDGATSSTYALTAADVGSTVVVRVRASNDGGDGVAVGAASGVILPLPPATTHPPAITGTAGTPDTPGTPGTAQQGTPLTVDTGAWKPAPTRFEYQWQRCDAKGAACVDIPGATSSSYTPSEADVGSTVVVRIRAIGAGGATVVVSAPSTVVAAPSGSGSNPAVMTNVGVNVTGTQLTTSVSCQADEDCAGEAQFTMDVPPVGAVRPAALRKTVLGRRAFRVPARTSVELQVPTTKRGRQVLARWQRIIAARHGRNAYVNVSARVHARAGNGPSGAATLGVRLPVSFNAAWLTRRAVRASADGRRVVVPVHCSSQSKARRCRARITIGTGPRLTRRWVRVARGRTVRVRLAIPHPVTFWLRGHARVPASLWVVTRQPSGKPDPLTQAGRVTQSGRLVVLRASRATTAG